MGIIKAKKLGYDYVIEAEDDSSPDEVSVAVNEVDIDIQEGEFVAILGHNGSGKSTLAKHMNALLLPTRGTIWIDGKDTKADEALWEIRRTAGMVFQNPDNQIISSIVEEDVAFGPENMGVPGEQIRKRVDDSLNAVGMSQYRHDSPNRLSGGQKQRVAIAGVMAMEPKCIVLDEPTAMLDPNGRSEVIKTVDMLNKTKGITIVLITHYMEEVINADRIFVMDEGSIVMEGTPEEIFAQVDRLKSYRLDVPQVTELAYRLRKRGLPLSECILTKEQFTKELMEVCGQYGNDA